MHFNKPRSLFLLNIFIITSLLCDNCPLVGGDSVESANYRVKSPNSNDQSNSVDSPYNNTKLIPRGCYGQKQLRELMYRKISTIDHDPDVPLWCNHVDLIPEEYSSVSERQTSPSPYEFLIYPYTKSDVFRVVLMSKDSEFQEVMLGAKKVDENGQIIPSIENRGRFLPSPGVEMVCCAEYDKDVAWVKKGTWDKSKKQIVFYWLPEEVKEDDFEGQFKFQAMIAKNDNEYWIHTSVVHEAVDNY